MFYDCQLGSADLLVNFFGKIEVDGEGSTFSWRKGLENERATGL
jgi:hypothetical protein